jgi:hypothetical protein
MYATVRLQVPVTELNLLPDDAGDKQKQEYREGRVLAVPERAVIDTGSRQFVYREAEPDVFEGVEVELGPRCEGFYPVVRGLKEGERVATTGSFLIDAETRLSAGASSTYFGASGGPAGDHRSATTARPSMTRDEDAKVQAVLAKLDPADRRLAEEQGLCPVLNSRLGSMGVPVSVTLGGQKVFLCCKACVKKARTDEKATLARVAALKEKVKAKGTTRPRTGSERETASPLPAKVKAALAKLPADDRKLAEAQRWCVVQTDKLLGSMGKPVKLMLKGKPVFLCCAGCEDEAREGPDKTLATAEKLKAKARDQSSGKGGRP